MEETLPTIEKKLPAMKRELPAMEERLFTIEKWLPGVETVYHIRENKADGINLVQCMVT